MKFLEIYNRNKNCADFQSRQRMFKIWSYLSKIKPEKYKITWDSICCFFRYFEAGYPFKSEKKKLAWIEKYNSKGKYYSMGEYERRTNY